MTGTRLWGREAFAKLRKVPGRSDHLPLGIGLCSCGLSPKQTSWFLSGSNGSCVVCGRTVRPPHVPRNGIGRTAIGRTAPSLLAARAGRGRNVPGGYGDVGHLTDLANDTLQSQPGVHGCTSAWQKAYMACTSMGQVRPRSPAATLLPQKHWRRRTGTGGDLSTWHVHGMYQDLQSVGFWTPRITSLRGLFSMTPFKGACPEGFEPSWLDWTGP